MRYPLSTPVQDDGWIQRPIGSIANMTLLIARIFVLPVLERSKTKAGWMFISGWSLMAIAALGRPLLELWRETPSARRFREEARDA